jgi:hypothetical protein
VVDVNGGFDTTDGWNVVATDGSVSFPSGAARLETGSDAYGPFSAVLIRGDDGSFAFADPIQLTADTTSLVFDVSFLDLGPDGGEPIFGTFSDYLGVNLYDSLDPSLDLQFVSALDFAESTDFATVSLDVSSLAGRSVALSFELNDEADGRDTAVRIDDVCFANAGGCGTAVPEPSAALVFGFGLWLVCARVRRLRS